MTVLLSLLLLLFLVLAGLVLMAVLVCLLLVAAIAGLLLLERVGVDVPSAARALRGRVAPGAAGASDEPPPSTPAARQPWSERTAPPRSRTTSAAATEVIPTPTPTAPSPAAPVASASLPAAGASDPGAVAAPSRPVRRTKKAAPATAASPGDRADAMDRLFAPLTERDDPPRS